MTELLCYVVRPDNTALWIPEELMRMIGAKYGERITKDQLSHHSIQQWIKDHTKKKSKE